MSSDEQDSILKRWAAMADIIASILSGKERVTKAMVDRVSENDTIESDISTSSSIATRSLVQSMFSDSGKEQREGGGGEDGWTEWE